MASLREDADSFVGSETHPVCDAYVTWGLLRKAKPSLAPFVISADDQEQTKMVVNNCLNILNFGWDNGAGLLEV
eukprot:7739886-Prorocentrum_lima.AAC.1